MKSRKDLNFKHRLIGESMWRFRYKRIPGDACVGGFTPPASQFINLTELCTEDRMWLLYRDVQPIEVSSSEACTRFSSYA